MATPVIDLFLSNPKPGRKIKILIVEDEQSVRQLWEEIVQSSCDVCRASTTIEAIDQMSEEKPDVMVLDWQLANGTANAALTYWMSKNGGPCCVVVNGISQDEEVSFYRRGVIHVLRKPVHSGIFAAIMAHYRKVVQNSLNYNDLLARVERLEQQRIVWFVAIVLLLGGGELLRVILPMLG